MSQTTSAPHALPILAALAGVLFTDYAQEIGQWIVCAHDAYHFGAVEKYDCQGRGVAEALQIGVLIAAVSGNIGVAFSVLSGGVASPDGRRMIYALLFGACLAAAKASVGEAGYPDPALLDVPFFAAAAFVGLHIWILGRQTHDVEVRDQWMRFATVSAATAAGLFAGLLIQAACLAVAEADRVFVVRPAAILAAGAAFGAAFRYDPSTPRRFPLGAVLAAATLAALWAAMVYYPGLSGGPGRALTVAICLLHLLPGIVAMGILSTLGSPRPPIVCIVWTFAIGAVAFAHWTGQAVILDTPPASLARSAGLVALVLSVLAIPFAARVARSCLERAAPTPSLGSDSQGS